VAGNIVSHFGPSWDQSQSLGGGRVEGQRSGHELGSFCVKLERVAATRVADMEALGKAFKLMSLLN
jgi:hypothetical protein